MQAYQKKCPASGKRTETGLTEWGFRIRRTNWSPLFTTFLPGNLYSFSYYFALHPWRFSVESGAWIVIYIFFRFLPHEPKKKPKQPWTCKCTFFYMMYAFSCLKIWSVPGGDPHRFPPFDEKRSNLINNYISIYSRSLPEFRWFDSFVMEHYLLLESNTE